MHDKNKTGISQLIERINEFYHSAVHTKSPFYLAYPFMDLVGIEKPIKFKRYKSLLNSRNQNIYANTIAQAMNTLLGNYKEYLDLRQKDIQVLTNKDINEYSSLIARRICNLLSSCFSYTEYCKTLLPQIISSPTFKAIKEKHINKDSCETIILQEVRHYSQHSGAPIHKISFTDGNFNVILYLDMLKKANLDKEKILVSYPNELIDVTQLLPQYIKQLYELHTDIIAAIQTTIDNNYAQICTAISEVQDLIPKGKERLSEILLISKSCSKHEKHFLTKSNMDAFNYYEKESEIYILKFFDITR
ncbi:hypothetical protein [Legionella sp. km772]|uniref:hypothetical protein n=1 Tax=Legionella sp. km772 TaxID=2498111 RepID=UPI000FB314CB|nr:hypothetical protein [Legionella sp. km772]RUR14262.1 hypothetical protein ELY15_00425 [Legionella sp. km772]